MMPEMDGFGVLEALREDGRSNDLPIIVISAMSEIDAVVRCVELGAEDFIFKPFNPTLLRARVLATLEKKALRDSTREELRRKQAELNEARTLQLALAPPAFNGTIGGHDVAIEVVLEPAKEVGGDLVDHFRIGEDLLVLLLGDVSDKGAGAALMMARTHSMFRSLAARPDAHDLFSAPEQALGWSTPRSRPEQRKLHVRHLSAGDRRPRTRRLTYVRAGHVPPFRCNGGGTVERLGTLGGPPLGIAEAFVYRPASSSSRRRPAADCHRRLHRGHDPEASSSAKRASRCCWRRREPRPLRRSSLSSPPRSDVRGRSAARRRYGGVPVPTALMDAQPKPPCAVEPVAHARIRERSNGLRLRHGGRR